MFSSENSWKGQEHNLDRIKKLSEMGDYDAPKSCCIFKKVVNPTNLT